MNETQVTLTGWLGNDPSLRRVGESNVASFRLGSTPRRLNRQTQEWSDGETQWYAVSAWRALADNCVASLRRGDPVVVHGRLTARTWTNAKDELVTTFEIDATFVGHDLNRGTSAFVKAYRPTVAPVAPVDPFAAVGATEPARETEAEAAAEAGEVVAA